MNQGLVFVSGIFNILHPGHQRLLKFSKECGTRLIIGILSDKLAGALSHVPQDMRILGLQNNLWVDEVFIIDEPIENVIRRIRPNIVVKGKEFQDKINPEKNVLEEYGGQLLFSSGEMLFSSLDLIRRENFEFDYNSIIIPKNYLNRHNIKLNDVKKLLKNIAKLKVCVIGDLIVDEYISCQPLGMSQEEATIVVMPLDSIKYLGGAGIVAAHAAGLGAHVHFYSISGLDNIRDFALENLDRYGVNHNVIIDKFRPTTLKQRYRSNGKGLLRINVLHQEPVSLEIQNQLYLKIKDVINEIDVLVFSDFNYGCLPQNLVDKIIQLAKSKNIFLAADSQSSSQLGNVCRFNDMELITPTEREARISLHNNNDGLVVLAEEVIKKSGARNVFLKLGKEGFLIQSDISSGQEWETDRLEALNSRPKDVAGAGDSLLISSALIMAAGGNIWQAGFVGALAAAIQVGRIGNTPINIDEIFQEIN